LLIYSNFILYICFIQRKVMVNIVTRKSEKEIKSKLLVFLFSLLVMLVGCDSRDTPDDSLLSTVQVTLDWKGMTNELPEYMKIIFYSKDKEGRKVEDYLPAEGGELEVPAGSYRVVIYNYNTESVQVRGEESYETIEAYTGYCTGLSADEAMVWSPDAFYVAVLEDVVIEQSETTVQMELTPQVVVRNYSFDIQVVGAKNLSRVVCHISGLNGSYWLGKHTCTVSEVPINVETYIKDGVLYGDFSAFISPKEVAETRVAGIPMMLTLKLVKTDNTVQEVKVDITELIESPSIGEEPGEPEEPGEEVHIEVPVPDGKIEVDDVESGTGGGIGGDVGDWDDETGVELPM
jgi:hypothetical protein